MPMEDDGQKVSPCPKQGDASGSVRWEHFDHVADMGIRAFGSTLAEAFEQAGLALTAVVADLDTIRDANCVEIECRADDPETLFVDWLNALIYEMAVNNMLFRRFEVRLNGHALSATVCGERVNVERHHPVVEVKGATYTALEVRQTPDTSWMVQTVVDV